MTKTPYHVLLIKPAHYDDDGYPLQWHRSIIPSNSLACVHGLVEQFAEHGGLGPDVEIKITSIDESNVRVQPKKLIDNLRKQGGKIFVGLVGVQSNQYPRSLDLARQFRAFDLPVCIGGFHVSGVLSMFDKPTPELDEATAMGVGLFLGEAEDGRIDEVLRDAWNGEPMRVYNWLDKLPGLEGAPIPILPRHVVDRTYSSYSSFDLGRGCPVQCSFCTIINVQGRVSRFRSADDLEQIVRQNREIGIDRFMLTDDNLARNRNWEACFDRLIELREKQGIKIRLIVQVDTLCHRIPGFIEKAVAAGVDQVFIGMENVNPDNLLAAKKKQNRVGEYREMLLAWKTRSCIITAGYIIGFPNDTKASIARDITIIKNELPLDLIYFTYLTPLPGCEDHKNMIAAGTWTDPDLNKYDLNHRVSHHPRMSDQEWEEAYHLAWETFYTRDHLKTILRRAAVLKTKRKTLLSRLTHFREFHRQLGVHPLEGGVFRLKYRKDRRPGMPIEGIVPFYWNYIGQLSRAAWAAVYTYSTLRWYSRKLWADPNRFRYSDAAIIPVEQSDDANLELFTNTRGGSAALAKWQADKAREKVVTAKRPKAVAAE